MTETDSTTQNFTPFLARVREIVTNALRYWEPRRLVYNAVLATVVLAYFFAAWPSSKTTLTVDGALVVFVLAVLANVAYCAAYLGDLFVQVSGFQEIWYRWRWLLFVLGTIFAAVITRFFSLGFFSAKM
jgi:hypothetical protein